MKIGEAAAHTGVPTKTIRFWEARHLLAPPRRTTAGYRDYEPNITDRHVFIRQSQAAGFTLEQIREVLTVADDGQPPCGHVSQLITRRLSEINDRIGELTRMREHLTALAARAGAQDPSDCHGYCSIISG